MENAAESTRPPRGAGLWLAGARPKTLPAAVVPVLVGTACAVSVEEVIWWRGLAAGVVALFIQIGTNFANDYSDGVRGTDAADRIGPLRLVGSGLVPPRQVKLAALASFGVAALAGLALAAVVGWWLILVGAVCLGAGWLYTGGPRPYGYAGLGELFVFVFFGLVATVGSTYVQTGGITLLSTLAAVPVGLLATALLVVNNLRDIRSDSRAGKNTLAVRLGDHGTRIMYVVLIVGALVCAPVVGLTQDRPWAVLALLAGVLAVGPLRTVRSGASGLELIDVLGATGRVQLAFGLLFAAGIALSGWV